MAAQFDKSRVSVLVVDDEESIRNMLTLTLKEDGWQVENAANGKIASEMLAQKKFHMVISDIQMPEMSGIELLEWVKKNQPHLEFVIMTSNASLETALQAIKLGAYDYLTKPFEDLGVVPRKLEQVGEKILLRQQNQELLKRLKRAGQTLQHLFDFSSELNGILEESVLVDSTLKFLPLLFEDETVRAAWLRKDGERWVSVKQIPGDKTFTWEGDLKDPETLIDRHIDYRYLETIELVQGDKPPQMIILESLQESITDMLSQEVRTCFQKVSLHQDIVSMANRDGLTRLYNHRYFQDRLRQELATVRRQAGQVSVLLMDVDNFKHYNDSHGHPAGDALLKQLAHLIDFESGRREADVVARYGGEEFIVILPFTPYEGALTFAERIRAKIEAYDFAHREKQPLQCISVSMGVATFPAAGDTTQHLVEAADKALYLAKKKGRNCVVGFRELEGMAAPAEDTPPRETLGSVLEESSAPEQIEAPINLEVEMPEPPDPSELEKKIEAMFATELPAEIPELKVEGAVAPAPNLTAAPLAKVTDDAVAALMSSITAAYDQAALEKEGESAGQAKSAALAGSGGLDLVK